MRTTPWAGWFYLRPSIFGRCGHLSAPGLRREQPHGFMERGAFDAHEEVDGVAGLTGVGADPVVVLDDDILGKADNNVIVVGDGVEPIPEVLKDRFERGLTGAADLRAVPDHGLFSSEAA